MAKGIAHISCIPLRAEPGSRFEMVSQLLLGETYEVLEEQDDWLRIRMDFDLYEGWLNRAQFLELNEAPAETKIITVSPVSYAVNKRNLVLSMGSELGHEEGEFVLRHNREVVHLSAQNRESGLITQAKSLLGAPYLWGGRTFMGIDCSGFVQVVFKSLAKALPRDAKDQARVGETLSFLAETKPGDLVFFDNAEGNITHVGILMNQEEVIHASGLVRIDRIDSEGIFNVETGKYTHHLRLIKRPF